MRFVRISDCKKGNGGESVDVDINLEEIYCVTYTRDETGHFVGARVDLKGGTWQTFTGERGPQTLFNRITRTLEAQ